MQGPATRVVSVRQPGFPQQLAELLTPGSFADRVSPNESADAKRWFEAHDFGAYLARPIKLIHCGQGGDQKSQIRGV